MSDVVLNQVRKGFYLDSVVLMRMSKSLAGMDGVVEAAMMMGSPSNRQIMKDAGLLVKSGDTASGGDLIIGICAVSNQAADAALATVNTLLDQPLSKAGGGKAWRPRTLRAAVKAAPHSNLVLISVAGDFAVAEARKAIRRGLHAMIFSDNISLAEEAELKREARDLGCLVMGPDCGTAIINGTPLAFANVVPRGNIGLVGASGTGTQEVSCLIAQYGGGISHAIGVGGRDLKSEVGGISTLMAIDALKDDLMTKHIVVISKPPPADVAAVVLERIAATEKPATICFIGAEKIPMPDNATQVFTLKAAAQVAVGLAQEDAAVPHQNIDVPDGKTLIQGLFSGGTLCAEAQVVLAAARTPVQSNAPIPGVNQITTGEDCHIILDLGDDQYTQGKPHPMIDPSVRDDMIIAALGNDKVGVVLLDVVIGYGAHSDPAGHLAEIVQAHRSNNGPAVVASITGTQADPQVRSVQMEKLQAAGIHVAPTNEDASIWALSAIQPGL